MDAKILLLVEDDESHVELIKRGLEKSEQNFEIIHVSTISEAKNHLAQLNPDIILSDWRLPDGDGVELLKMSKEVKNIPVIIMTGFGNEKYAVEAMKLGAMDYIVKTPEILLNMSNVLNRVLREFELIETNKRIKSELNKNEEMLTKIFNNAIDIIFVKNRDKEYVTVNKAFLDLYNLELEEVIGETDNSLTLNVDNYQSEETDNKVLRGETVNILVEVLVKDKTKILNIIKSPLYDTNKEVSGIFGIGRDITEIELQKNNLRKLFKAVEQSPAGIIIANEFGKVQFINKRFTQITNYTEEDIIGKTPVLVQENPELKDEWLKLKTGEIWTKEIYNKKKTGEHYWSNVAVAPITNDDEKIIGFVGIIEDTTEKKEFEKELIKAKEEAIKADKLKSEFLAQMSHEIRTPINTILSFSSLLKMEIEDKIDNDFSVIFEMMEISGKRIIRTIDLLLNMSELQTGSFKPIPQVFDVKKRVLDIIYNENINDANKKNLQFIIQNRLSDNKLYGDEYSIHQIISILTENAIKFTEKGGVEVVVYKDEKQNIIFEVRDTGIGISEEYMKNLFTPFSQEEQGYSRKFEGNGLGLAVAKRYCELNNATITVTSKKGEGSVFKVSFPHKY